jgi:hypothetical protein
MYPYPDGLRWLIAGRYSHLVKSITDRRPQLVHPTLRRRVRILRRWNTIRFAVSVLLSIGIIATVVSAVVNYLPGASDVLRTLVAISTAFTGILTVTYLFLTRLLGQVEIDILTLLMLEGHEKHSSR